MTSCKTRASSRRRDCSASATLPLLLLPPAPAPSARGGRASRATRTKASVRVPDAFDLPRLSPALVQAGADAAPTQTLPLLCPGRVVSSNARISPQRAMQRRAAGASCTCNGVMSDDGRSTASPASHSSKNAASSGDSSWSGWTGDGSSGAALLLLLSPLDAAVACPSVL